MDISCNTIAERKGERGLAGRESVRVIKEWVVLAFHRLSCLFGEKDYWEGKRIRFYFLEIGNTHQSHLLNFDH